MRWTFLVLLRALPAWLALDRAERDDMANRALSEALSGGAGAPAVTMRFFDAEAFSARCSDFALFETADARAWYDVIERLRSSPLLAMPYFEIVEIIPAFEDGFRDFARREDAHAAA